MTDAVADPPSDHAPVLGDAQATRSRVFSASNPWLPVLVGVGVAFLATLTWLQWWRPYLEHDDWDMLLPNGATFVENHSLRLLHEGRWLNNWWWMLGSQDLSPRGAAILFTIAWLIVVAVLVRSLSIRWWSVPAVTALYAAPMMSMLSFWPATLAAPMWVLALTICLLWVTRDRWNLHLAVLVVGTIIIALGYPPLALILVPFLVVLHHGRSWRPLVVAGAAFALAYIGGVLLVFTLNDLRFGIFGLKIQSWRNPSTLSGLTSLGQHLHTVRRNWEGILRPAAIPVMASLVAVIATLLEPRLRRRLLVLAVALVGCVGLSASSTILNGVDVPARAMGWFWPFLVLVAVWGLEAARTRIRVVGAVVLTFIAVWSGLYAAYATTGHRSDQNGLDVLRASIVAHHNTDPTAPIIFAIPHLRPTAAERQAVWEVANAMAKLDGIRKVHACVGCHLVPTPINPRQPQSWVYDTRGRIVVQLPGSLKHSGLRALPEPSWLVPWR